MSKRVTNDQLMDKLNSIEKSIKHASEDADLSATLYFSVAIALGGVGLVYGFGRLEFYYITAVGFGGALVVGFLIGRRWWRNRK